MVVIQLFFAQQLLLAQTLTPVASEQRDLNRQSIQEGVAQAT